MMRKCEAEFPCATSHASFSHPRHIPISCQADQPTFLIRTSSTDIDNTSPPPITAIHPYCPKPAPSSPPSSDSPIRHRLFAAGYTPLALSLAPPRQLPILTQADSVSVLSLQNTSSSWARAGSCPLFCSEGAERGGRDIDVLGLSLLLYSFNLPTKSS
jgi:hypothetical protein